SWHPLDPPRGRVRSAWRWGACVDVSQQPTHRQYRQYGRSMRVQHLIVGAGFAGLCSAIKLQPDGETDFLVVERGSDGRGTWRENTYPGATCDIPSQLYSFSFAPNRDWSMSFSPQPEIQAYLRRVARESGTLDRFIFDTRFEDAAWDDDAQVWRSRISGPGGE